jgi:hypothetical protein
MDQNLNLGSPQYKVAMLDVRMMTKGAVATIEVG